MIKSIFLVLLLNLLVNEGYSQELNDFLVGHQWGIKNTGQSIIRFEKELIRKSIKGKLNQDINFDKGQLLNIKNTKELIVAVVDTGVDINHPDLKGRIWYNSKICKKKEDELSLPCHGFNFLTKTPDVSDDIGHGTHVAGVIAANWNKLGTAGITTNNIKIMPIKVLSKDVEGFIYNKRLVTDIIADGIRFAINNKADVINLSIGWPKIIQTPKMNKVLDEAYKAGIPIVAAAGNNNKEVITFPCNHEHVICVGAIDNQGQLSSFTNFGGKVDIAAPGESILSTYPSALESRVMRIQGLELKNGTSSAAPFVTGIIANIKNKYPEISIDEIKARIFSTSSPIEKKGNKFINSGMINLKRSLTNMPAEYIAPVYKHIQDIDVDPESGAFTIELPIKNYLEKISDVDIDLSFESNEVNILSKKIVKINFLKNESKSILIKGSINDLLVDSKKYLHIRIRLRTKELYKGGIALYFYQDINKIKNTIKMTSETILAKDVLRIKDQRKFSNLRSISSPIGNYQSLKYFYINKRQQKKGIQNINIIDITNGVMTSKILSKKENGSIISIFYEDINLDGEFDFFVYSYNAKKKKFIFELYDKNLKPLFGNRSIWEYPLSVLEGLSLKFGFIPDFNWMKIYHEFFGTIVVPSFFKKGTVPDLDNSQDILLKLPSMKKLHLYYLLPKVDSDNVIMEERVIDSYQFNNNLRSLLNLDFLSRIDIVSKLQHGNLHEKVEFMISIENYIGKEYYKVSYNNKDDFSILLINSNSFSVSRNKISNIIIDNKDSEADSEFLFIAKINRTTARIAIYNNIENKIDHFYILKNVWVDPIFDIISSTKKSNGSTYGVFIESRYHIIFLDKEGEKLFLPINRDSSFPMVKFKENFLPLNSVIAGTLTPSLYVDSTQIFGDRLYIIAKHNGKLIRPIVKSYKVPKNCLHLFPMRLGPNNESVLPLSCVADDKRHLKLILLKL